MRIEDFDYALPAAQIAQVPALRRDSSRLLVYTRSSDTVEHHTFADLPGLLAAGTVLVFNDTRVIRARLRARKPTGGAVELLVLNAAAPTDDRTYACLARSTKPLRPGTQLDLLAPGNLPCGIEVEILEREAEHARVRFHGLPEAGLLSILDRLGEVPLPPYIV